MEDIILQITTYKEDHPEIIITNDMIKNIIEENIEKLIEEIKENI